MIVYIFRELIRVLPGAKYFCDLALNLKLLPVAQWIVYMIAKYILTHCKL